MPETLTTCPVCGGNKYIEYAQICGEMDDYYYFLCACGAAFMSPRMTEDEVREYYTSGVYRQVTGIDDTCNTEGGKQQIKRAEYLVKMIVGKIYSHLDIGSSHGDLLRAVNQKNGGACVSVGVDMDPVITQDEFPVFPSIDEVPGKYDLITCIQTLEHINNPRPFIESVRGHMNTNGVFMVEVPNRRATMMAYSPPHHVIAYDEKSLRSLFGSFSGIQTLLHGHPYGSPLDVSILLVAGK